MNVSKYTNAYYSDENKSSSKFISKIEHSTQGSIDMKSKVNSQGVPTYKWKYPTTSTENSKEKVPNILVNDNDQLHVIKE